MAEVCPAGALLSVQAAPPQCLPLPLPAVCLSRELCLCVGAGSAKGRDSSSHPSRALSVMPGSLGTVKFPNTSMGMVWQSCSLEWAPWECSSLEKWHPNLFNVAT